MTTWYMIKSIKLGWIISIVPSFGFGLKYIIVGKKPINTKRERERGIKSRKEVQRLSRTCHCYHVLKHFT